MAGNQFGAMVDSSKKQLEWWWYKGQKQKKAIRFPKQSEDFSPREGLTQPVAKKHPLDSAHAQMLQHEAQKKADGATQQLAAKQAGGTIPKNPAGSPTDPASAPRPTIALTRPRCMPAASALSSGDEPNRSFALSSSSFSGSSCCFWRDKRHAGDENDGERK